MFKLVILCFILITAAIDFFPQDILPGSVKKLNKAKIKTRTEYLYFLDKNPPVSFKCQKKYFNKNGNDTLSIVYSITTNKAFSKIRKKFDKAGNILEKWDYKVVNNLPKDKSASAKKYIGKMGKTVTDSFKLDMIGVYKFNEQGRFVKKEEYDENNNLVGESTSEYSYDKFGRIIEIRSNLKGSPVFSREVFEYDSLGNKTRFVYYLEGKFKTRMDYSYDSLNKIIKILILRDSLRHVETEISKYDINGNRVLKEIQDKDGKTLLSQVFKYDRNNRYIEMIRISNKNPSEYQRIMITYDKYGNIKTNTKFNGEGKAYRRQVYNYTYYK